MMVLLANNVYEYVVANQPKEQTVFAFFSLFMVRTGQLISLYHNGDCKVFNEVF